MSERGPVPQCRRLGLEGATDGTGDEAGRSVRRYAVDGVYIDQIAAAGPAPCWDPTHNHTLGGGYH